MIKFIHVFLFCYLLSLLYTLFFTAHAVSFKYHDVDSEFNGYTSQFYSLVAKNCPAKVKYEVNYYTIEFGDTNNPDDWVGYCKNSLNGYLIVIDRAFWKNNSNGEIRRELIFHELSHCVIYRDHSNDINNYMFPSIRVNMTPSKLISQTIHNIQDYCNE